MKQSDWYRNCLLPSGCHYLKGQSTLEGIPVPEVKKGLSLVPSRPFWGIREDKLLGTGFPATSLINLRRAGLVKFELDHRFIFVTLTEFGRDVKRAIYCPDFKVKRSGVPTLIEKVKAAIIAINAESTIKVTEFFLFGSYINTTKEILSDLDVAIDIQHSYHKDVILYTKALRKRLPRAVHLSLYEEEWPWECVTIPVSPRIPT